MLSSLSPYIREMQNSGCGCTKNVRNGTVRMDMMELPLSGEQHWQTPPPGTCQIGEWQRRRRSLNEGDKARNISPLSPAAPGLLSTPSQPLGVCTPSVWRADTTIPAQCISSTAKRSGCSESPLLNHSERCESALRLGSEEQRTCLAKGQLGEVRGDADQWLRLQCPPRNLQDGVLERL